MIPALSSLTSFAAQGRCSKLHKGWALATPMQSKGHSSARQPHRHVACLLALNNQCCPKPANRCSRHPHQCEQGCTWGRTKRHGTADSLQGPSRSQVRKWWAWFSPLSSAHHTSLHSLDHLLHLESHPLNRAGKGNQLSKPPRHWYSLSALLPTHHRTALTHHQSNARILGGSEKRSLCKDGESQSQTSDGHLHLKPFWLQWPLRQGRSNHCSTTEPTTPPRSSSSKEFGLRMGAVGWYPTLKSQHSLKGLMGKRSQTFRALPLASSSWQQRKTCSKKTVLT